MSEMKDWTVGDILWQDLTIPNAIEIRDIYREVIDWNCVPEDMGGH